MRTWITWIKEFARGRRANGLSSIEPREQFQAAIMRERAAADRNQHVFSLLLFNIGDPKANSVEVQHLAQVLANRIRLTDEVGWFDNKRIGVLLRFTSTDGAQTFADDICQAITAMASLPEYTIYIYPSKWFSNGNGHLEQLHFSDINPEWKTTATEGFSASIKYSVSEHPPSTMDQVTSGCTHQSEELAEPLESPFLCSLPIWKRVMDVLGASVGLVVLSPVLLLVTLIIKTGSPGPVIFKQQRVGRSGQLFTMLKFRTMKHGADNSYHEKHMSKLINGQGSDWPMTKPDHESQLIQFGKILRKMSIDEIPQLLNVLCGQMSIVGPRPPIPYEVTEYSYWHYERFDIVPGMTGLWQVSGKNRLTFSEMVHLDIRYSRKLTFRSDIRILLKTPLAILSDIRDSRTPQKKRPLVGKVLLENA